VTPALVYIAGPYRSPDPWRVELNIRAAEELGYRVAQLGAYPVIPHSNTRGYFASAAPDELWLTGTLELMRRCDAVILVEDWENSSGSRAERAEAFGLQKPVFLSTFDLAHWLRGRGA
jgi:nucleoside 2-deoxyribosyltransferase